MARRSNLIHENLEGQPPGRMRAAAVLALVLACAAALKPSLTLQTKLKSQIQSAFAAAAVGATLVANPLAASASLEDAAVKVADTSYPIISTLQKKEVAPVVSKALGVALTGDPIAVLKVAKAADEALLSTDTAKLVAALKSVDVALSDALKSNGVIPPLADVEDVAKKAAAALATTDKAKIKETFSALTQAANSADKLQVVGVLADGSKLASKINPADAAAATGAVLDLLKESGAQ